MSRRLAAAVLAASTAVGCPHPGTPPDGAPAMDGPVADVIAARASTGIPGCDWAWDPATALTLPVATRAFELEAACVGDALVAAWRADGTVSAARRAMTPEARWEPLSEPVTTDATAMGDVLGAEGSPWLTWQSAGGWLRVARLDRARTRASGPVALVGVTLSDPHVLYAAGESALLAATARSREGSWAMVLRLGLTASPPQSGYILGGGTLAAAAGGPQGLVAWTTTAQGRPGVLHGARIDGARAMALDAPLTFEPIPRDVVPSTGDTEIGAGGFEFAPSAALAAGAVLFQPVSGTSRSAARVAWFSPGGGATVALLPMVPGALGSVTDADAPGRISVTCWDDHDVLHTLAVAPPGTVATDPAGGDRRVVMPLAAPVEASLGTREVSCGGQRWTVFALRSGGVPRLYAQPSACVAR